MASSFILIPLVAVILFNLPFLSSYKRLPMLFGVLFSLWQAWLVLFSVESAWNNTSLPLSFLSGMHLHVTHLTLVMYLAIAIAAGSAFMVCWHTLEDENKRFDVTNLLLLALAGMNGVVSVTDLFTLYVFIEVVSIASFILIALHKDGNALEGSLKYIIMSAMASLMMLSAIALFMMTTGSTSFSEVANALRMQPATSLRLTAVGLFLGGLFIKSGSVPFHGWLPDAYSSAPAGVSVLLAGIVTKTTGIYTLIRLVTTVFGFTPHIQSLLLAIGALSIVVGALAALTQSDMKRMLAYSSISQMGYIIIGLGTGTTIGFAAAVFHLLNHAIFKTQLFVSAAAIEEQTGTRNMDTMGGLAEKMPITGATSIIGFLSMAGIPPLSGFWSKLIIIIALWMAGFRVYALIAVSASVLTLAYMLSLQRRVFFGKLAAGFENLKEAELGIILPSVVLAALSIVFGIAFPFVLHRLILPIAAGW
ncbi:MAG: proton-conducting transporter membrane subunit [Endomicrobiales bacterium]|jgi:multicomponent Na+:H+ antiporter subunit D